MRVTTILITTSLIFCNLLLAKVTEGQTIRDVYVNLNIKNKSLEYAVKQIEKQSDFRFAYKDEELKSFNKVSISAATRTVEEALVLLLDKTGLMYKQRNNYILLVPKIIPQTETIIVKPSKPVNDIRVNGKITDKTTGQTLIGVSVRIKDGSSGVITDVDGNYTINAPEDGVLVVSYIGYNTEEIPVSKKSVINIAMSPSSNNLNEVVVVGYGTQKKVNLTGAVATVGSDKLDSRPLVNLGDGLNGLVPNLNVNINNGQPGTGATYNIRGYTTIGKNSSSSPLILVDGVQRDPNLIDPNDVASVTVLKDAASSAIYGSRAANGVILITTKTGKKGVTQLSYSGSYTTSRPTKLPEYLNSQEYINIFRSAQRTGAKSGGSISNDPFTELDSTLSRAYFLDPANNPDVYIDPANPLKYRYVGNTDWIKVLYPGWAPQQQHYLSLTGGEGKTTYVASMGYFSQDGLEKLANQVYKRYTPSLKVNTDFTPWLTLNLTMSMTHTDNDKGATTAQAQQAGGWIPTDLRPTMPIYNPDGHYSGQGNFTNPLAVLTLNGRNIDYQNDFWTTGRIILKPAKHLSIVSDYTWNSFTDFDRDQRIPYNEYGVNGVFLNVFPHTNPSQVQETRYNNNYNALNAYATYENTFNNKHYFKALAGFNQEYQHYQIVTSVARNLIDPGLPAIGVNNDSKPTIIGTETQSALIGSFFRLNYIYDRRYLIEVDGRYDGTSRFPANDRYAFSPSVSAGWNIAEEHFMEQLKNSINELKLRASYGQLPNQQVQSGPPSSAAQYPYIATQLTGTVPYLFNNQPGVTVAAPGLISSTLTWEKVQTKNIGLDYSLLNYKLTGSFDYFITDTKDMLVASQQLPAVLGTTSPLRNEANLRTKGWEISVSWKDRILNDKLFYNITLGLSDASSKITKYALNNTYNLGDYYPGEKLGEIWGYVTEGYYKTDEEAAAVDNSNLSGYKWLAGDIKYADLNKDGKINNGNYTVTNPGDRKIIGNNTPRYRFGFNLSLGYKDFDFTTFIQGVLKADFAPAQYDNVFYAFQGAEWNVPYKYAADFWTPENTNAYFPRARFNGSGNQQTQTKYLLNAAYGRIKQLTLGYSLPKQFVSKLTLQKVRVYVTGANLFTITSLFPGYDPEIVTNQGNFQTYPINKSVSFGIQATL